MRAKKSFQYQFQEAWQAVGLLYVAAVAMRVFAIVMLQISGVEHVSVTGKNFMTACFMLALGIGSFGENFKFLIQNGVSRKSILIGKMLVFWIASAMCVVGDGFLSLIETKMASWDNIVFGESLIQLLYPDFASQASAGIRGIVLVLLTFIMYVVFAEVGWAIAIIWYRLNKVGKMLFGFGIPITIWFIYPMVDYFLFDGKTTIAIVNGIMHLSGIAQGQPLYGLLSGAAAMVIFGGLSGLLIKSTQVKREN